MNSKIILCKNIKLDRNYVNVLNYTETEMLNLCNSNGIKIAEASDYSFIERNKKIRVNFTYNLCVQANYIAFQNPDYSNKWFFAFIDNIEFKGNMNTEISFTIDSWSTWFDYWSQKPCFVVREHVNDDTIWTHTVPENLDVGEVIEEEFEELEPIGDENSQGYYFAIEGTYNPITDRDFVGVTKINGSVSGSWIFLFPAYSGSIGIPNINNFLADITSKSKIESIKNFYILPSYIVDNIGTTPYSTSGQVFGNYTFYLLNDSSSAITLTELVDKITSFNGYTPKNKKCFCYPFNYMLVSNNVGNNIIYKYEDFVEVNPNYVFFEIQCAISVGGSVRLVPRQYKNISYNYDESLPLAKFPTCSWSSDAFTNWLTQNGVDIATNIVSSAVQIGSGNIGSGASNIASLIGQFYKADIMPSITGGNNTGDVNFANRNNTFSVHHMRSSNEYMRIIDDYFTRYGYKINRLKTPNITGRRYWNYIEIGDSDIIGYGEVPTNFMENINNACRKGVTIWHNHENIGDYNLSNTII